MISLYFYYQAVSSKGTKRLHGAFEGGFSAGYFNTVGSKEGWKPSEFVSSRDNRFNQQSIDAEGLNRIENYMDEDDIMVTSISKISMLDILGS